MNKTLELESAHKYLFIVPLFSYIRNVMTKRHILAHFLSILPVSLCRNFRIFFKGRYITILCYHRIMDIDDNFPYDSDLVSASTDQFRDQLKFISRNYNVVNFKSLRKHFEEGNKRFPEKALIITFDDGYIDNYEVAFPLLREFGLTATMFVTAGFIGRERLFWWDRIAYIIKKAEGGRLRIKTPADISLNIDQFRDRQECARKVIKKAKTLSDREKEGLIEQLSDQLGVDPDQGREKYTMSWDQLKEMSSCGIEIGAHSVNHPIFSNVDSDRLRKEVGESKQLIEDNLEEEIITFGSPGRGIISREKRERFNRVLTGTIKEYGYRFSTLYKWGLVYENSFDPFGVERIGIETHDSRAMFKAKLMFPELITY